MTNIEKYLKENGFQFVYRFGNDTAYSNKYVEVILSDFHRWHAKMIIFFHASSDTPDNEMKIKFENWQEAVKRMKFTISELRAIENPWGEAK